MEITLYSVLCWIAAIFVGSTSLVIFIGSNKSSPKAYSFSIFLVTLWMMDLGLMAAAHDPHIALLFTRLSYYLGSCIAASFVYFFLTFPDDSRPGKRVLISLVVLQLTLCYIAVFTDKIVSGVFAEGFITRWGWYFGDLSYLFEVLFFGFFIIGLIILYSKYKASRGFNVQVNLRYMLMTILVGVVPPSFLSVILPRLGYFDLDVLGAISEIIWVPIMAYSILRYRQMNVRILLTEVLAIAMAAIFFINIFITEPFGMWPRIGTFVVFLIMASYLIRGVLREAIQREELKDLNTHLNQKVIEQTVEIRKSYEAEKKARLELEKLNDAKDQFIMITQHHLRTPLTSVIWELEAIQSGAHGVVKASLQKAMMVMKLSTDRLMQIVNDFLNITAIKIGTSILNLSEQSLKPAIESAVKYLQPEIVRAKLNVEYPKNDTGWPVIKIDSDKMREIILIVVENAVRYNQEHGSVEITTDTYNDLFELVIRNTGIGISAEEKEKIGSALFYRGKSARNSHPIGMGIGLAVVKAIIKAHHGTFSIESDGEGRGAKVTIRLPK